MSLPLTRFDDVGWKGYFTLSNERAPKTISHLTIHDHDDVVQYPEPTPSEGNEFQGPEETVAQIKSIQTHEAGEDRKNQCKDPIAGLHVILFVRQ